MECLHAMRALVRVLRIHPSATQEELSAGYIYINEPVKPGKPPPTWCGCPNAPNRHLWTLPAEGPDHLQET